MYTSISINNLFPDYENVKRVCKFGMLKNTTSLKKLYFYKNSDESLTEVFTNLNFEKINNIYYNDDTSIYFYDRNLTEENINIKNINLKINTKIFLEKLESIKSEDKLYYAKLNLLLLTKK